MSPVDLCPLALLAVTSCSGDTRTLEQRFQSALDDGLQGHSGTGVSDEIAAVVNSFDGKVLRGIVRDLARAAATSGEKSRPLQVETEGDAD